MKLQDLEKLMNGQLNESGQFFVPPIMVNEDDLTSMSGFLNGPIETINRAKSVIAIIKQSGNFILNFTGQTLKTLLAGISKTFGNTTSSINRYLTKDFNKTNFSQSK